jgi:hypothetical protein
MTLTGKIYCIGELQSIKNTTYVKQEFVLLEESNPKYPQHISFELFDKAVQEIAGLKEGQEIKVDFNIKGRKWDADDGTERFFNTLSAWKIETPKAVKPALPDNGKPARQIAGIDKPEDENSDMPF